MILINGREIETLPALDRGLLYGHSVFETLPVLSGQATLWDLHLNRVKKGCQRLGIPLNDKQLEDEVCSLASSQDQAVVLRITLTLGAGGRGYASPETPAPNRILSVHPLPDYPAEYRKNGINLGLSEFRLSHQAALAGIKHGNRLEQVLARQQWQDDWQEALLMDQNDWIIEATSANVFVRRGAELVTPELTNCGVQGVIRDWVLAQASDLGFNTRVMPLSINDLKTADEIFICNSLIGAWPTRTFLQYKLDDFSAANKINEALLANEIIPNT